MPLALNNAVGGGADPATEKRLEGLWSATLAGGPFAGNVAIVAGATATGQNSCGERFDLAVPPIGWQVEIETIDPVAGFDPAIDGLDRVAVQLESGDGSLPLLALSRYLYDPAQPGVQGLWQTIDTFAAQTEGNAFKNIVADLVDPGENLYRVTVDGHPGVEDIDGFYAVPVMEDLTTGTDTLARQRRQALVFRDAVRSTVGRDETYANRYAEQVLVGMGTQERGNTFSNEGDGIMQVTSESGVKGRTECGQDDGCLDGYTYTSIARSIGFNIGDALLVLNSFYNSAQSADPLTSDVILNQNGEVDELVTAIVYYNAGTKFVYAYEVTKPQERGYLEKAARQLQHHPIGGNSLPPVGDNLSIFEFLVDADYTAEITDLVPRLQAGQTQVCEALGLTLSECLGE